MPLPSLVRNGGVPRPAMLERTAAAWRDRITATGRISLEVVLKQKSLHISEIRAMCADTRFDDWEQDQTERCILLAGMPPGDPPRPFQNGPGAAWCSFRPFANHFVGSNDRGRAR